MTGMEEYGLRNSYVSEVATNRNGEFNLEKKTINCFYNRISNFDIQILVYKGSIYGNDYYTCTVCSTVQQLVIIYAIHNMYT